MLRHDDVAQHLVVAAVVRRVDDPLLLPRAPRMRAGGAERDPARLGDVAELLPPLAEQRRGLGERVAAPGADLDLGRDQLADEVRLELRAERGLLELLEAVDETERLRVEERELLLDRDREVGDGFEGFAGASRASPRSRPAAPRPRRKPN